MRCLELYLNLADCPTLAVITIKHTWTKKTVWKLKARFSSMMLPSSRGMIQRAFKNHQAISLWLQAFTQKSAKYARKGIIKTCRVGPEKANKSVRNSVFVRLVVVGHESDWLRWDESPIPLESAPNGFSRTFRQL